jgi:3-hydroxybutyryl-CoA dehydrogenase
LPVKLIDTSQAAIDKGLAFADKLLAKDVGKQRISEEDAAATRKRLSSGTSLEELSDVDFVIEAVPVRFARPIIQRDCTLMRYRKFRS